MVYELRKEMIIDSGIAARNLYELPFIISWISIFDFYINTLLLVLFYNFFHLKICYGIVCFASFCVVGTHLVIYTIEFWYYSLIGSIGHLTLYMSSQLVV